MFGKKTKETLKMCRCCFMCRHACPVFLTTKLDSNTPRGYALMLSRIDEGIVPMTDSVVDKLYECAQCGLCKMLCAFHWEEDEVVRAGREKVAASGRIPKNVKDALAVIEAGNTLPVQDKKTIGKKSAGVLYYGGREAAGNSELLASVEKILKAAGVDYAVLKEEYQTGAELYELGLTGDAKTAAKKLADALNASGAKRIVTSCAHAYKAFTVMYPKFGIKIKPQVQHMSEYIEELIEAGQLMVKQQAGTNAYAYHDPCQLGKGCGVYGAPRMVIEAVTGKAPQELFHAREEAECCGAGSAMYLTNYDLSLQVARRRVQGAMEDGADVLVTACPNCYKIFDECGTLTVIPLEKLVAGALS